MGEDKSFSVGENVTATITGNSLTLKVDLSAKGSPSKTGKTVVIASTRGNANVNGVNVGLNVYRKA